MWQNKFVFHFAAVLLVLLLVNKPGVAGDLAKAKEVCNDLVSKIEQSKEENENEAKNIVNELSKDSKDKIKDDMQNSLKNELGYSKVFDKFKDYVNDCMSESNFDEQYDECMEEIGKKAVEKINENKIEKIVEKANVAASNETSRNRKDDFVAALKEKKCADKLTEDDDENEFNKVVEAEKKEDDKKEIEKEIKKVQKKEEEQCKKKVENELKKNGDVKKCVDVKLNGPVIKEGEDDIAKKCDLADRYVKKMKRDMKMPQAPVKSNPVKDLHDEMEDLLVDAWDGKELYDSVGDLLVFDILQYSWPKYKKGKKDVIKCMHETKQNEDVLQDVEKCMKEEHKEPENSNDDLYSRMKPYIDDYEKFKDRCKIAIKNEEIDVLDDLIEKYKTESEKEPVEKKPQDPKSDMLSCIEKNKRRGKSLVSKKMKKCLANKEVDRACIFGPVICGLVKSALNVIRFGV